MHMLLLKRLEVTATRLQRDERGAVMTETAIVLPILFILFLGLWELGPHMSTHHKLVEIANVGVKSLDRAGLTSDVECIVDQSGTAYSCQTDAGHLWAHNRVLTIMALQGFNSSLENYQLKSIRDSSSDTITFTIEANEAGLLSGIIRPVIASVTGPYLNNTGAPGTSTETGDTEIIDILDDPKDEPIPGYGWNTAEDLFILQKLVGHDGDTIRELVDTTGGLKYCSKGIPC